MEKKSSIIAIGLTVHNAPVELREKLAVPEAEWQRAIEELCSYPHIEEAAVLSTCNRMEIYVVALSFHRGARSGEGSLGAVAGSRRRGTGAPPRQPLSQPRTRAAARPPPPPLRRSTKIPPAPLPCQAGVREVEDWMSRASGVGLDELRPHLFLLRDRDATGHLLRVAGARVGLPRPPAAAAAAGWQGAAASPAPRRRLGAGSAPVAPPPLSCPSSPPPLLPRPSPPGGLDSLVMGEGQILAQVKQVHKVGQNAPGFGRHLNGLFKQAVTAGKRVRAETSISSGAVSVSSAAAELAQLKLPTHDFNDAKVGGQLCDSGPPGERLAGGSG